MRILTQLGHMRQWGNAVPSTAKSSSSVIVTISTRRPSGRPESAWNSAAGGPTDGSLANAGAVGIEKSVAIPSIPTATVLLIMETSIRVSTGDWLTATATS